MMSQKAVVLLSGGIDSSVCLAIARAQGFICHALSIDYNQRNIHELQCAKLVASQIGAVAHRVIRCEIGSWGGSALTDHILTVDGATQDQVNTYVPARNMIFLSLALGWAEVLEADAIFFAANAEDYINYPDCRPEFFEAMAQTARLGTRRGVKENRCQILTPLLNWNKAQIIREGRRLNVNLSQTFSCYDPLANSQPCTRCLACHLRTQGFAEAAIN
jgi:7-cyano-7-deazaguanine synthase